MTISRFEGELEVECDLCEDVSSASELDMEDYDFQEFVNALKADGWMVEHSGGKWIHTCPDCQ